MLYNYILHAFICAKGIESFVSMYCYVIVNLVLSLSFQIMSKVQFVNTLPLKRPRKLKMAEVNLSVIRDKFTNVLTNKIKRRFGKMMGPLVKVSKSYEVELNRILSLVKYLTGIVCRVDSHG